MAEIIQVLLFICILSIIVPTFFVVRAWLKFRSKFKDQRSAIEEMMRQFKEEAKVKSNSTHKQKKSSKINDKPKADDAEYTEIK